MLVPALYYTFHARTRMTAKGGGSSCAELLWYVSSLSCRQSLNLIKSHRPDSILHIEAEWQIDLMRYTPSKSHDVISR